MLNPRGEGSVRNENQEVVGQETEKTAGAAATKRKANQMRKDTAAGVSFRYLPLTEKSTEFAPNIILSFV